MVDMSKRFWTWLTASRKRFSFACLLVVFGLLLWSRLILVSNMPRTAIADDEEETTERVDETEPGSRSDKAASESTQGNDRNDPKAQPRVSSRHER